MFTGLVESTGEIVRRAEQHLQIRPHRELSGLQYGESIAVNGCCLTFERQLAGNVLEFFTLQETLRRTNLSKVTVVNLERALRVGDRLGGHLVSGHIDATGEVLGLKTLADGDIELKISLDNELAPGLIPKGSVAIDGVSLTIVELTSSFFTVHLIPVTLKETALSARKNGDWVNLESDMIGKYVRRQLGLETSPSPVKSNITMETLMEHGFL